jgi:MYXO-CTERM domain-containing protein
MKRSCTMKHEKLLRASAVAISLGLACAVPAAAQTSGSAGAGQTSSMDANTRAESGDRDWGWLGLLGLIGLAGLRRRRDPDDHRFERTTTRRPTV